MVLGGSDDGGYYLIGVKRLHQRLFEQIDWSTERVFAQTLERAREIGLQAELLPTWYDVDDAATLERLRRELARLWRELAGYDARHTRSYLESLPKNGLHCEQRMLSARYPSGRAWLTNSALALLGLSLVGLCRQGVNEIHHFVIGFGLVAMYQALLYLVAVWVVLNRPVNRWTFVIILACAAACRLVCLFSPPFLSTDIFRYVWDGRVQAAGINPYRYIPADPHLAFLRDLDIYPHINRRSYAHTIYPPGAQMLFLLITRIGASVRWMKAGMVGLEALTIWALVKLLAAVGLRREQVLIYAWHPLLLWEVASSGHVDGAALPLIALALLFYVRHKPAATGFALAAATLVKLYPIALFPALYRRSDWRDWRMPAAVAGVVAAGYACYLERRPAGARFFARLRQGGGPGIREPLLSADAGPPWLALGGAPDRAHSMALPPCCCWG